jgi:hypothetical protein
LAWVEVDLVRPYPVGAYMEADPQTVIGVIRQMRDQGKGIIGVRILGQGAMRSRQAKPSASHSALACSTPLPSAQKTMQNSRT